MNEKYWSDPYKTHRRVMLGVFIIAFVALIWTSVDYYGVRHAINVYFYGVEPSSQPLYWAGIDHMLTGWTGVGLLVGVVWGMTGVTVMFLDPESKWYLRRDEAAEEDITMLLKKLTVAERFIAQPHSFEAYNEELGNNHLPQSKPPKAS